LPYAVGGVELPVANAVGGVELPFGHSDWFVRSGLGRSNM
jgi:hypothetical protein